MSSFTRLSNLAGCLGISLACAISTAVYAQTNNYGPNGTEYSVVGALPGDQVFPDIAVTADGGVVAWQDNATDGEGWGISARRLDSTLSGTMSTFRVNVQGAGNQENSRVAMLKNGGSVFVWQGGQPGMQHIFARFMTPSNTWLTSTDMVVSTFTNNFQANPAVTVLNNSNVVVTWGSFNQASSNSMQDVYAKILSPTGATVVNEFLVNQFTSFNQRTPAVAALNNGGFVMAWVSEQQRTSAPNMGTNSTYTSAGGVVVPSVDVYARIYAANGVPAGSEFLVNADNNPCANPTVAVGSDGGFVLAWGAHDMSVPDNSWDIFARAFSSAGTGGLVSRVNSHQYGDQYGPRISSVGLDYLVVWTSLAQDGSREGVFGQFLSKGAGLVGNEFRVNETTVSQQMQPAVASDGSGQFIAIWTSFTGSPNNFDLFAQRYINGLAVLQPMSAPYVWAPFILSNGVYQPALQVSWAPLLGLPVSSYEVYVDGAATAAGVVSSNQWTMTSVNGLTASSTHSFKVDYVLTDGRRSPISDSTSGTTWQGYSWGGIPFEWMTQYYGSDISKWPSAEAKLGSTSFTVSKVFLSGGNPLDATTWLKTEITKTAQGMFLGWNTQPGATYQVQATTDFVTWQNLGTPRFAAGTNDSIFVGAGSAGYYRVYLLR